MNVAEFKECRGRYLKLSFSIMSERGSSQKEKISAVHNVDNLSEIRFRFVHVNENVCTFLSLKKHASAKDSNVRIDVRSADLNYSQQWVCTEHWIDWQDMGINPSVTWVHNYWFANFVINIVVTKEKSFTAENIYRDEEFTDFHLGTAEGRVAVHRVHLAAHSEVFKMMLNHEWKEKTEGCIQIEGATLETLKHLKKYMYMGTLPDDGLRPLLLIARCYLMDNLKSECISKLVRTATSEDLEDLLNFAIDNKITELALAMLQLTPDNVVHGAYELKKLVEKTTKQNNEK